MVHVAHSIRRRRLGRVAEFCPFCRTASVHDLFHLSQYQHLLFIPLSSGSLLSHEVCCKRCGARSGTNVDRYTDIETDRRAGLDELIALAVPEVQESWRARIAMEQDVRRGRISAELRTAMLREPFVLLAPQVEERSSCLHIGPAAGLLWLLAVGVMCFDIFWHGHALRSREDSPVFHGWISAAALGTALIYMFRDVPRFVKRRIEPRLISALTPLQPSLDELEKCVIEFRKRGQQIGRKVSAKRLYREIQKRASAASQVALER